MTVGELFTPRMYVDYYTRQRGISVEDIGVAPVVVLSWGQKVIHMLADAVKAQPCPHWFFNEDHVTYPLYTGLVQGRRVSFALTPEGAPATVMMMEEMIACGARVFLGLGWAGSLQPSAPVGTLIIPTSCICEEGTSLHYPSDDPKWLPDAQLVGSLRLAAQLEGSSVICGVQWTTDAPYRELIGKIRSFGQQGALGVDMETSAMYALGRFRGVKVCNILVVSDELWDEWHPAFRSPQLTETTELAQRILLRCLAFDLQSGQLPESRE